jgi:hypothetical protein
MIRGIADQKERAFRRTRIFVVRSWIAVAIAICMIGFGAQAAQPIEPAVGANAGPETRARVEQLFLVSSSRGPLRSVVFSYRFPGRDRVAIRGLGSVASEGSLQYLTIGTSIEFLDPATGKSLLLLPLTNPVRLMAGRDPIAIPRRGEFPPQYRTGRWSSLAPFPSRLMQLLNSRFPSGFLMDGESPNAIITSYRELNGIAEPLYGRLAVMVEPPAGQAAGSAFRVRFVVQERRSHTAWRAMQSSEVQRAAQDFVTSLVAELEGGEQ